MSNKPKRVTPAQHVKNGGKAVMIDIETLGTRPTAPFYEVGAILFHVEDGKVVEDGFLHRMVRPDEQIQKGAISDKSTMDWTESKVDRREALKKARFEGVTLAQLHADFASQIDESTVVFVNGANFDPPILAEAFARAGMDTPWSYWNVIDLRAVMFVAETVTGVDVFNAAREATHDGLDDCRRQIDMLIACFAAFAPAEEGAIPNFQTTRSEPQTTVAETISGGETDT